MDCISVGMWYRNSLDFYEGVKMIYRVGYHLKSVHGKRRRRKGEYWIVPDYFNFKIQVSRPRGYYILFADFNGNFFLYEATGKDVIISSFKVKGHVPFFRKSYGEVIWENIIAIPYEDIKNPVTKQLKPALEVMKEYFK